MVGDVLLNIVYEEWFQINNNNIQTIKKWKK
jgi:hypothetical protein